MTRTALSMLVGDGRKFLGMVLAVAFGALLVTQQAAIFQGVMTLTYGPVSDVADADLWVVDRRMQHLENTGGLSDRDLDLVRGTAGIAWASPVQRCQGAITRPDGSLEPCTLMGLDDATLAGGPRPELLRGCRLEDLRRPWTAIVDAHSAAGKLRVPLPGGGWRPLAAGDLLSIEGQQVEVAGTCATSMSLMQIPTLYLRRSLGRFLGGGDKPFNIILAGVAPGTPAEDAARAVAAATGLAAYTAPQLERSIYDYFLYSTGIPANFAIAVLLGFVIGAAIAGQTYHQFIWDHRRIFATLASMGMRRSRLIGIVAVQTAVVGLLGFGLGVGGAALFGLALQGTDLSFRLEPALLAIPLLSVLLISAAAALAGVRLLGAVSPSDVFRSV